MSRRTLEETRELLLQTGATMLADEGVPVTLDAITIIDVCRAAGLKTAGSGYKIWDTQEAFRDDLLHELLVRRSAGIDTINTLEALFDTDARADSLDALFRAAAVLNAEQLAETYSTYLAIWLARRSSPELAATAADAEAVWLSALTTFVGAVVDRFDLELIAPFDLATMAVTLSALAEGLEIRRRVTPELVPDELAGPAGTPQADSEPWTPLAIGFKAVFDTFTRPRR